MRGVPAALGAMLMASTLVQGQTPAPSAMVRLRPTQSMGHKLVKDGLQRSSTFRRIVGELDTSDVIVYIELRPDMASHIVGSLRFVAPSATDRFLKISLNRHYDWPTLIAFLGHELQHAREVAGAPEIRSAESLRSYYQRNGIRVGRNAYDSAEAQATGQAVRAELRGGAPAIGGRMVSLDRLLLGSGSIDAMAH